jgi:hypothetical protein
MLAPLSCKRARSTALNIRQIRTWFTVARTVTRKGQDNARKET